MSETTPRVAPNNAYISHPDCALHEMGSGHPESPQRLHAVHAQLQQQGLLEQLQTYTARAASDTQLIRVHSASYLAQLQTLAPSAGYQDLDSDTRMNPHTLQAARLAAGAVVQAIDLVIEGATSSVFCNVRPPGHHAPQAQAMGFCFFNNAAVGIAHALEHHGLERVALIDFDVHHGNGSEAIFAQDLRVLMCSTFQADIYPFSGKKPLGKNMVNVPLPARSNGQALRQAVAKHWLPALHAFAPQLIVVSAGFDAHTRDPLAGLRWVEADYAYASQHIMEIARHYAQGRVVSCLEGGYDLNALARSAAAHVQVLTDPQNFARFL